MSIIGTARQMTAARAAERDSSALAEQETNVSINDLTDPTPDVIADPADHFASLTPTDPSLTQPTINGAPIVAMTAGVARSFAAAGHVGADQVIAFALPRLLPHAVDTAEKGEPAGNLYEVKGERFTSGGGAYRWIEDGGPELWIKQNHPHHEYIVLWPSEY